jgi:predicted phage terminase large subunit-like protein
MTNVDSCGVRKTGDKLTSWKPLSAQSKAGNVKLLRREWNNSWLYHMHGQPDLSHDDIADASAGAYNEISTPKGADLLFLNNVEVSYAEDEPA